MTGHSRQAAGRIRPEEEKHVLRIDVRFGSKADVRAQVLLAARVPQLTAN